MNEQLTVKEYASNSKHIEPLHSSSSCCIHFDRNISHYFFVLRHVDVDDACFLPVRQILHSISVAFFVTSTVQSSAN